MLKHRDLHECTELYELLSHPSVFPFVRQKATSADEYWFMTKQLIEEEARGLTISRTITDDWGNQSARLVFMILKTVLAS